MAIEKSTILVDAAMNLTGISDSSIKRVKQMIKDTILSDNNIKLNFDKNGQAATLKQLNVVYDKINNIKKMAAGIDIGGTQYKIQINDFADKRKEIIKLNQQIAGQEKQINTLKTKGVDSTEKEREKLNLLNSALEKNIKKRESMASGILKDSSITGTDKYKASNLLTSSIVGVKSNTKLVTDAQKLNSLYDKQAYLIKAIAKANSQNATISERSLKRELKDVKSVTSAFESKIKKSSSPSVAGNIIDNAKQKLAQPTSDAATIKESSEYKKRNVALNNYKNTLREIEKTEYALAQSTEKYRASVKNKTEDATIEISGYKKRIAYLKELSESYLNATNAKFNSKVQLGNTKEYNEALKTQEDHLLKVSTAQKKAAAEYSKSNNLIKIMGENFKAAAGRIIDYTLVYRSLWAVFNKVKQAIGVVIELDKSFTDIKMVTGDSKDKIDALKESYSSLAKEMGATVDEVASGATEWLRQGKSVSETNELLKQSMILSKTGAMESSTATDRLTSTINGYKMSVSDASKVVDVLSKLDMVTATSADELSEAFTKTANSAHDAGIPFENLAGLIATVSSVTRKSATSIGESYKTLSARFMNIKVGKFVDDETGESINDTESVLNKLGIQLRKSKTEWRDMWDVMNEIGKKWNTFNDAQKDAIVVAQAGVRQAENLRATYNNWDMVLKNTAEAYDSVGFAAKKYKTYLDSIEGRTKKMIATFQSLVNTDAFNSLIKSAINLLTKFGEIIKSIGIVNIAIVALGAAATLLGSLLLTNIAAAISTVIAQVASLSATMGTFGAAMKALQVAILTPTGAAVLAGVAILGVIKLVQHFTTTLKEQNDKVDKLTASLQSLNSEYDTLKSKTILTDEEKKRLEILEKEIKLTEILQKKEKERAEQMLIDKFTAHKQTNSKRYGVSDENLSEQEKTNKEIKNYNKIKKELAKTDAQILKTNDSAEYEKLTASRKELNSELSKSQDKLSAVYQTLTPLLDSEKEIPTSIGKTMQALESVLGLTNDYTDEIAKNKASKEALTSATVKMNSSQKLSDEEYNALIKLYPQLADGAKQAADGWTVEKSALDSVTNAVTILEKSYVDAQNMMTKIANSAAAQRLGILESDLMGISSVADAYELFAQKSGGSFGSNGLNSLGQTEKEARMGTFLSAKNKNLKNSMEQFGIIQQNIKDAEAKLNASAGSSGGYIPTGGGKDKSSSSEDPYKNAFETKYKTLQYQRDKYIITEKEYYTKLKKLNDDYFKGKKKYLDEWEQYDVEVSQGLLQVYEDDLTKKLDASKTYIEGKNQYDNWGADSEIEAWTRVLKWMKSEFYPQSKKQKEIFDKDYKDATTSLVTAIEAEFDKQLSDTEHARKVSKFNTGVEDTDSLASDMEKISQEITKGYYEVDGEIIQMTQKRYESLQDQWMQMHEDRLSALETEKTSMESYASAASDLIDHEIDNLNKKKDVVEGIASLDSSILELNKTKYQATLAGETSVADAIQSQIDYIEEQKDIISQLDTDDEKRTKIRKVQLEVQKMTVDKLKEELELIKDQKTQRVYSVATGWTWTSDKEAEFDKEQEILDAQTAYETSAIDDQISSWEDYKKAWTDVVDNYKLEQDALLLNQNLGASTESSILNQRISTIKKFASEYKALMEDINNSTSQTLGGSSSETVPTSSSSSSSSSTSSTATATTTSGKTISVSINSSGKTTTAGLTAGTVVHTAGGNYKITGGTAGNYTSVKVKHDGINSGLVGDVPFNPSTEVLTKLAKGEGVFTAEQMKNVVKNMTNIMTSCPLYQSTDSNTSNTQKISIANITLPSVKSGTDFMNQMKNIVAITGNTPS